MSLLVIHKEGLEDRVFRIRRERVTIGREQDADLVLDDVSVSRLHAHLVTGGGRCELFDQASTNGVKVNGAPTQQRELEHGDIVKIGKYRLEYCDERKMDLMQVAHLSSLRSATSGGRHSNMSTLHMSPEEVSALSPAQQDCAQALLVRKDTVGGRWRPGASRLTIGPGGDVPVELMLTGQPVAELRWDGDHHLLRSHSWAHRVQVNGEVIRETVLQPGDAIQVGEVGFVFTYEEPGEGEP